MKADRFIVNVEAAVVHGGRYLMVQRSPDEEFMPGGLVFPGGKVQDADCTDDVLERTARRETLEETGVSVGEAAYIESHAFLANGAPVVDVVMLCRYVGGAPRAVDPSEVVAASWMEAETLLADASLPSWTRRSLLLAERMRAKLGW
jgi:8-oxo-dGTP pyrophosphatase MutT (NUDIX family)